MYDNVLSLLTFGYVILMANVKGTMSLMFIVIMLLFSFNYVVNETQDAADADPTHNGKALIAQIMPYLWIFLIVASAGATIYVIAEDMN